MTIKGQARDAAKVLDYAVREDLIDNINSVEEQTIDLITNLLHLNHQQKSGSYEILEAAKRQFEKELFEKEERLKQFEPYPELEAAVTELVDVLEEKRNRGTEEGSYYVKL